MCNKFQINQLRSFFLTGSTRSPDFRAGQLRNLASALDRHETRLHKALYADLRRSPLDAYTSETGYIQSEIRYALQNLRHWSREYCVCVPPGVWPASATVTPEPKGVVLIIGPWNYPLQLVLSPLVAAITAGNCAIIKPSELTPHTSAVLKNLIEETFDPDFIRLVEGGRETAEMLLCQPLDHIFFTGGTEAGRAVAQAAAKQLIPVTLELGGKNPVIIGETCDPTVTARRIVRGKFMNAGQLCVAPDHVWVPRNRLAEFTEKLKETIHTFYGSDPQKSSDIGRIVNRRHFDRLVALCPDCLRDADDLYIAPTLIPDPPHESALMRDEIFGPLLPVLPYDSEQEVIGFCRARPVPLALYLFTGDRKQQQRLMAAIPSGGVCINDTVTQLIPKELPFGGRGASGMGAYHGKAGFDTFSHFRSVLTRSTRFDIPWSYPPITLSLNALKKLYRFFI
ncbi:MAG: aldehyde dehydrogenase family protein [Pontiellaceae bacterium]|jgi:aldehyde dehydrogenase (NAD+)|nr:aldehyde dehydrogenase family protein [Pontiellaceae bacterium]